jgi:hypothetical protein
MGEQAWRAVSAPHAVQNKFKGGPRQTGASALLRLREHSACEPVQVRFAKNFTKQGSEKALMNETYDVVVVGSGSAGMAAALRGCEKTNFSRS